MKYSVNKMSDGTPTSQAIYRCDPKKSNELLSCLSFNDLLQPEIIADELRQAFEFGRQSAQEEIRATLQKVLGL